MRVLILYLLAEVMLCFLGLLLSLRATTSEVPGDLLFLRGRMWGMFIEERPIMLPLLCRTESTP
jgi:hypothetical protein